MACSTCAHLIPVAFAATSVLVTLRYRRCSVLLYTLSGHAHSREHRTTDKTDKTRKNGLLGTIYFQKLRTGFMSLKENLTRLMVYSHGASFYARPSSFSIFSTVSCASEVARAEERLSFINLSSLLEILSILWQ